MTAVLFMGGWLSPMPFPPFTWVPGVIWFLHQGVVGACSCSRW